jgi:hypothetical protein
MACDAVEFRSAAEAMGATPGRSVAQERQTEKAMPELYLSSP